MVHDHCLADVAQSRYASCPSISATTFTENVYKFDMLTATGAEFVLNQHFLIAGASRSEPERAGA